MPWLAAVPPLRRTPRDGHQHATDLGRIPDSSRPTRLARVVIILRHGRRCLPSGRRRGTWSPVDGGPVPRSCRRDARRLGKLAASQAGARRLPQAGRSRSRRFPVGRTHLAITVELVHGPHTGDLWPRPGRVLIASRSATFEQFATAIDDAFARWDRSHLHEFTLARLSEQFAYIFDLGDNWQHLCTVEPKLADPMESLGIAPGQAAAVLGLGRHSRPVRPPLERRRRQHPDAVRTRRNGRSPADPALVGTAALASTPGHPAIRRGHRDPLPRPHHVTRVLAPRAAW